MNTIIYILTAVAIIQGVFLMLDRWRIEALEQHSKAHERRLDIIETELEIND